MMRTALVLGLATLLTGCLSTGPSPPEALGAGPEATVRDLMASVPCDAPFSEDDTTANLLRLNYTPFDEGGPQEIDIRGDLLLAARLGGFSSVDISNPLHPKVLDHYGDAGGMLDVKFTPGNQTALVGSYHNIDLVDVRDPSGLRLVGRWAFGDAPSPPSGLPGQNAHMVFPAHIGDSDWVFLAPQSASGVWVLKLTGGPDDRNLTFVTTTMPVQGGQSGPHDIFLQFDEDLHKWILYTADAFLGWTAFDVSDPTHPSLIVAMPNADFSGTHSVQAAKIGDRRIVVTTTEFGMDAMKVWDATDLSKPVQIGYWTRKVGPEMYEHQHNINIVDVRLYMAHYAHGLFVFDLTKLPTSPTGLLDIAPVAHYASSQRSVLGSGDEGGFWDLVVHDGLLYAGAFDGGFEEGLHVIGYGCMPAGDPLYTSTG